MRSFKSGATRGSDTDKIDPEAALSPLVLTAYCEYVKKHRLQGDGSARSDENWQLGIPPTSYMKSLWRHLLEAWKHHRGFPAEGDLNDALCAIIFNAQGMLHERLKKELTPPAYGVPYVTAEGDNATLINAAAIPSTSNQRPLSRGEQLERTRQHTTPVSSPQPTIYPDDWPDGEL